MGIFLIAICLFAKLAIATYNNEELLLVVEVSRHGARSSKEIFDFTIDPDRNFKNSSELTQLGRFQHFHLGHYIRTKYI